MSNWYSLLTFHSIIQQILSAYYVQGTFIKGGTMVGKKVKISLFIGWYSRGVDSNKNNKTIIKII